MTCVPAGSRCWASTRYEDALRPVLCGRRMYRRCVAVCVQVLCWCAGHVCNGAAFDAELALYEEPVLRSMMPATKALVDNKEQTIRTQSGYVIPPCIVIERGESLQEWAAREDHDFVTILQARAAPPGSLCCARLPVLRVPAQQAMRTSPPCALALLHPTHALRPPAKIAGLAVPHAPVMLPPAACGCTSERTDWSQWHLTP
jgi:hypothetical protein